MVRFKTHSWMMVALMFAVQIGMYIMFSTVITQQEQGIADLDNVGEWAKIYKVQTRCLRCCREGLFGLVFFA